MPTNRPSRRHFLLFLLLTLFAFAQLGWWIIFQMEEGARVSRLQEDLWAGQIATARQWLEVHEATYAETWSWLAQTFPDLELQPGGDFAVSEEARQRLDHLARGRVRMFVWEGGFFTLVLLAGVGFMLRTLRREILTERRQSVFLSATSHELKTPITSLRLYLDTLMERDLPPEQKRELMTVMQQDLQRLTDLIDRLLQAQNLSAGRRSASLQLTNLTEETRAALDQYAGVFGLKGCRLDSRLEENLFALADPDRWQVVVKNLLDNACKYSPSGSPLELRLVRAGKQARLEVTDHGAGLEKGDTERIFERFYRADNDATRRARGTGLGLYLARVMVESFGGKISARSPGPGQGSTFIVELPLARGGSDA
ncbi:MAG: sensor histidine kinase [Candidatus Zixiibacteriota bacterium]|nr:MAG: sensor histidine kinase [candidate division Zixibacteria bacterium]